MNIFTSVFIIAAFGVIASLQDTPHSPCNDGPLPAALRIEGCDSSPCNIYRGSNMIAQWDFAANADAESLTPRVKVNIAGMIIDYPYPEKDACKSLTNGQCPLDKGDKATYNLKMPINKNYPSINMNVEFALVDENKNVQVCFKVDGTVTDE